MNKDENKIFVITKGEYSDYHIVRVFTTRKLAKEFLDTKDNDYRLEVYDLDEPFERKTNLYCISFQLDRKKVVYVHAYDNVNYYKDLIRVSPRLYKSMTLDIYVESDSRKRALKVASERYGAILANEQTIYPYLRVGTINNYSRSEPAYFDFNTGELVLLPGEKLMAELPPFIKIKKIKEK
jgi:hypothetical protein